LLYNTGRLKEAEAAYQDALAVFKQLAADFPTRPEFRQELARNQNNLGNLLYNTGRLKEAEAAYQDALAVFKQLAADFLSMPDYCNEAAGLLGNLALLANQHREFAAARERLEEALPYHRAALKANPRHPIYRQFYRSYLWTLAASCAGAGDRSAAASAAQKRRDLGWNPPADSYDAACALAQCVPIVAKDDRLNPAKRKAEMDLYGDEAMKLLRDAVAKGYKNVGQLKNDNTLAPLRPREDFQKLLAELEATQNRASRIGDMWQRALTPDH
jgi:tetratricopeptide (TPR) repeat protein